MSESIKKEKDLEDLAQRVSPILHEYSTHEVGLFLVFTLTCSCIDSGISKEAYLEGLSGSWDKCVETARILNERS